MCLHVRTGWVFTGHLINVSHVTVDIDPVVLQVNS